jgi:hypothetical protein
MPVASPPSVTQGCHRQWSITMLPKAKSESEESDVTGTSPAVGRIPETAHGDEPAPIDGTWPMHSEPASEGGADGEARHRGIAERAYLRAASRGFEGGKELDDWLAAEAEMDGAHDGSGVR